MKKKAGSVLLGILILLLCGLILKHKLVYVIWKNLFPVQISMEKSQEWTGGQSYRKIQYADVSKSDYLNLYLPDHKQEEELPLVILIHGGGFICNDCESRQTQLMYRYLREHGYACATVNYRLAQEAPFPGAIEDVKAAVRYLKANAKKYGYSSQKIAIWGESAGAYLATMATVTNEEEFSELSYIGENERTVSGEIPVLLDFYGVTAFDREKDYWKEDGIPEWIVSLANGWEKKAVKKYGSCTGYWLRMSEKQMKTADLSKCIPQTYIKENLSKNKPIHALIWHGDADITVSKRHSESLVEQLKQSVGEENVEYELFHGYGHGADAFYTDENLEKVCEYLRKIWDDQGKY